jgi:hypothetical protein
MVALVVVFGSGAYEVERCSGIKAIHFVSAATYPWNFLSAPDFVAGNYHCCSC